MAYDNDTVAANLRAGRARLGLNQTEVAEKLGVGKDTISRYEHGDGPSLEYAYELTELYDMSLEEIVGRERFTRRDS